MKLGHADIFVKIDSRYENYTLAEIVDFSQELSNLLGLSSKGVLRLCWVQKGCFQLTFQIPLFVKEEIFPLSSEQERALAAEGVIRLTCGKYQFQVSICIGFSTCCRPEIDAWPWWTVIAWYIYI